MAAIHDRYIPPSVFLHSLDQFQPGDPTTPAPDLGCTFDRAATALRTDIDYVVTEYGARRIRHLPVMARAMALIEIAHPDFRARLRDQWSVLTRG